MMDQVIANFFANPAPPTASVIISMLILRVIKTTKPKEQTEAIVGVIALTVINVTLIIAWVLLSVLG